MGLFLNHSPSGSNPRRVFLAVPCYGNLSPITGFSLFAAHPELIEAGFDVELGLLTGDCHVDDARNRLVNEFLKSDCGDLVFIDDDVGFRAEDLIRVLSFDRDVVGGACPKKDDTEQYAAILLQGEIWSDRDGLIEVGGIGTGFLRIRRNVLEVLANESSEYRIGGVKTKQVFERLVVNGQRMSGDIAFCYKWRERGGKVYADPNCYLDHQGTKVWTGTFATHLKRVNGLTLSGLESIRAGTETDQDYLDLALEWGNTQFAATPELVKASVMVARQISGPILETGTGLTSLVMAAANPGVQVHALEHEPAWAAKVMKDAGRVGISNLTVHCSDLSSYPRGKWYSPPELPWREFQMVLCDGPPRASADRTILFDFMRDNDCNPRCILLDDAEGNPLPPQFRTEIKGTIRKFAVGLR